MPQITSILSTNAKTFLTIVIDNKKYIRIDCKTFSQWNLKKGDFLSNKQIEELINEIQTEKVMSRAVNYLSYRPRSVLELRKYLVKQISVMKTSTELERTVESILSRLKQKGMINDKRFIDWWIEQRTKNKPKGNYAIHHELRLKGVGEEAIKEKLSLRDEEETAKSLISKKIHSFKQGDYRSRQKIYAFLQRKGFSWNTVRRVVDELSVKK